MVRKKLRFVCAVSPSFDDLELEVLESPRDYSMPEKDLPEWSREIFRKIEAANNCYLSSSIATSSLAYISVSFPAESNLDSEWKRSQVIKKVKREVEEYFDRMEKLLPVS